MGCGVCLFNSRLSESTEATPKELQCAPSTSSPDLGQAGADLKATAVPGGKGGTAGVKCIPQLGGTEILGTSRPARTLLQQWL